MDKYKILFINFTTDSENTTATPINKSIRSAKSKISFSTPTNTTRIHTTPLYQKITNFIKTNKYPNKYNYGIFNTTDKTTYVFKLKGVMYTNLHNEFIKNFNINDITDKDFTKFIKFVLAIAFEYNIKLYKTMPMIHVPQKLIYVQMQQLLYGIINMYILRNINKNNFNDILILKNEKYESLSENDIKKRLLALLVAPLFNAYAITSYYYMLYKLVGFKGYSVYIEDDDYVEQLCKIAFTENIYKTYIGFYKSNNLNILQYFSFVVYKLLMNQLLNPDNTDEKIANYIDFISIAACYNNIGNFQNGTTDKILLLNSLINTYTPYNYYDYIFSVMSGLPKPKPDYKRKYIDNTLIDEKILTYKKYENTGPNKIFLDCLFENKDSETKPIFERMYFSLLYYSCYNINNTIHYMLSINSNINEYEKQFNNNNYNTDALIKYINEIINIFFKRYFENHNILYIFTKKPAKTPEAYFPKDTEIYENVYKSMTELDPLSAKTKRQINQEYISMMLADTLQKHRTSIDMTSLFNIDLKTETNSNT